MGRGIALVQNSRGNLPVVLLSDLKGTMTAEMELMANGESEPTIPKPPLVEILLHVMSHVTNTLASV